jgi:hypothetical protein
MIINTSNYLNYGNALEMFTKIDLSYYSNTFLKREFIQILKEKINENRYITEIVRSYGNKRSKKINIDKLRHDISNSFELRKLFKILGCRGFSYKIHDSIKLCGDPIREDITIRIALMPDEDIFYPYRVKRYLRQVQNNHYFYNGFPSIAFCLGSTSEEAWYIFVLQSDIAYRQPSYIREHFRGWRKILFAKIKEMAMGKTRSICLCRPEDVIKCCHPGGIIPKKVPETWREIYDATAKYFNMKIVQLDKRINIQTFKNLKPVYTNIFFRLNLIREKY